MRCLVGFMCVLALGLMGCSETSGAGSGGFDHVDGGTSGEGGYGGSAGIGGDGGSAGVGGGGGDGGSGGTVAQCVDNVCRCTEAGIRAAIAAGGAEPYTFDCGGATKVVTEAQIVIDNDVTLDGRGMLTIDGNDTHRVLSVATGITAELRGITVTGGVALPPVPSLVPPFESERGGGIYSEGTLTLNNCAVSGNHAENEGGGISTGRAGVHVDARGVLTLTNSVVSENTAGHGGGISGGGTLVMTNSKVVDNRAANSRGGIMLYGRITMTRSAVSDNTAATRVGGISQYWPEGSLIMVDSTVSGNTAGEHFGGIEASGALTLTNSTVSHNTAVGIGGGIYHDGTLTLTNSTVSNNTASGGGGIENHGVLRLTSSTISGNVATGQIGGSAILNQGAGRVESSMATLIDGECSVPSGYYFDLTSNGYNIESPDDTCDFDQLSDQVDVPDPLLGPLQDNGGPTMTHALLPGSPAIDKIPAEDCEVETDQRGEPRPAGTTDPKECDVGAFEVQP